MLHLSRRAINTVEANDDPQRDWQVTAGKPHVLLDIMLEAKVGVLKTDPYTDTARESPGWLKLCQHRAPLREGAVLPLLLAGFSHTARVWRLRVQAVAHVALTYGPPPPPPSPVVVAGGSPKRSRNGSADTNDSYVLVDAVEASEGGDKGDAGKGTPAADTADDGADGDGTDAKGGASATSIAGAVEKGQQEDKKGGEPVPAANIITMCNIEIRNAVNCSAF